jgi:hypothetical protein
MKSKQTLVLKIATLIAYLGMIVVNFLANALPIAGRNTGEVSDSYPNLFAPAGITFSIWGLIYLLLAAFVVFYLIKKDNNNRNLWEKVSKLFILSSLANIAWIFCWHYGLISLSVLLMLVILISLIVIAEAFNKEKLNTKEQIFLRLPFSVYFGWITVATIANISALLVSLSWNGWGITPSSWMIVILLVGALIGILRTLKDRNIPYILVFIWAYFGIWFKHNSETGFNGQYPTIINTVLFSILLFILTAIFIILKQKKKK